MLTPFCFISLLLFLPGFVLIEKLTNKFKLKMLFLEKLIAGSIIWNYIFASTSTLLGIFSDKISWFFKAFSYLSAFIILFFLIFKLKTCLKNPKKIRLKIEPSVLLCLVFLLPITLTFSIITLFVNVCSEWDVWAFWLPTAKSIEYSGTLLYNEFFLSKWAMIACPPYNPLVYAWIHSITNEYCRLIYLMYYFLLGVASYLLSKDLFERKEIAMISSIVSMSSLITLAALFGYVLHPDIPLSFFLCSSMIYLVKILKGETKITNLVLFAVSLSLLTLTRKVGIMFAYMLISFIILRASIPYRKILFTLAFISPINVFIFISGDQYFMEKFPLLIVYSAISISIVFFLRNIELKPSFEVKKILFLLIPFIPNLTYFFITGYSSGLWLYTYITNPSYYESYHTLQSMSPVKVDVKIVNLIRLDDIFLRHMLIIYTPCFLLGLASNIQEKEKTLITYFPYLATIIFLFLFVYTPKLFYPSLTHGALIRRHMYMMPLVSAMTAKGFYWLSDLWNSAKSQSVKSSSLLSSFILYNALGSMYILNRAQEKWSYPLNSILSISELKISLQWGYTTIFDFIMLMAILFVCLELTTLCSRLQKIMIKIEHKKKEIRGKLTFLFLLSIIVSCSLLYVCALHNVLTDIPIYGDNSRSMLPNWMEELVNCFNGIDDIGVVIGFQNYFLVTFSNRRIIDLSMPWGYYNLANALQGTDLDNLILTLRSLNVRYVIEPTNDKTGGYKIFSEYRKRFPVFDNLFKSEYLILLKSLPYYNVYKLATHEEYEEYLKLLEYYFDFEKSPLVISDDNQSRQYRSTIKNISISDSLDVKIKGKNSLKIEISPYLSQRYEYIKYVFQSPVNLSSKDFIAFYWYGSNTGIFISLRFETGDWRNQYSFSFIDSWTGWARLIIPLSNFKVHVGSPSWNNITAISFVFYERVDVKTVFYLDRIIADEGITEYYLIPLKKLRR